MLSIHEIALHGNARTSFVSSLPQATVLVALGRGVASTSSGEIQIDPTAHTSALSTTSSSTAPLALSDPASTARKLDEFEVLPTTCLENMTCLQLRQVSIHTVIAAQLARLSFMAII
jgi:hypothetical protein